MQYPISKNLWYLDEKLHYLNHASFGATPKVVMERFFELTRQVEENPMQFYLDDYHKLMDISRKTISDFLGCNENNLVYVDNATSGVNTVLRSLQSVITGDWEILTVDHCYPAVKNTLNFIANASGCKLKVVELPDFVQSDEQLYNLIISGIGEKTKMLVIDHISSISAIIFPIKKIIDFCRKNNILTLIDGAHAPGYLDLNLDELKPDWYTGNLHKWFFAPKSSAILYSHDVEKYDIHPNVISNDYGNGYLKEFDWVGTRNFCAWLTTPECKKYYDEYFNYDYCRNLSLNARDLIIQKLGLKPMVDEKLTGLMHSFWLLESAGSAIEDVFKLREVLLNKYNIEIFLNPFKGRMVLRTSSQVYNYEEEYYKLVEALEYELEL